MRDSWAWSTSAAMAFLVVAGGCVAPAPTQHVHDVAPTASAQTHAAGATDRADSPSLPVELPAPIDAPKDAPFTAPPASALQVSSGSGMPGGARVATVDDPRLDALFDSLQSRGRAGGPMISEARLRAAPVLREDATPWCYEAPFLLVQVPAPATERDWQQAVSDLERRARLLAAIRDRVQSEVVAPLGLRHLLTEPGVLPVVIVRDAPALWDWQVREGLGAGSPLPAVFSIENGQLLARARSPLMDSDIPAAGERVQRRDDQIFAHEATHQLLAAIRRRIAPGAEDAPLPMWIEEGLAEFVGGIEVDAQTIETLPAESVFHGRVVLSTTTLARKFRKEGLAPWPLEALMERVDMSELAFVSGRRTPARSQWAVSLWFFDAWAFVHFLSYYDDGVYHAAFTSAVGDALHGRGSSDGIWQHLGVSDAAGRSRIAAEFAWYRKLILRRKIGRRGPGNLWHQAETDPPTGAFDPDYEAPDYDEE